MANSIVKIGPPGGPFVEIDEVDGNTVFRVPNDQIDFENVDFTNVANALLSGGNFDGQGTSSLTNLAAVETEQVNIGGDWLTATDNTELTSAIADNVGIRLLSKSYKIDSISNRVLIYGLTYDSIAASTLNADTETEITLSDRICLERLSIGDDVQVNDRAKIKECNLFGATVNISADNCAVVGCVNGDVTFASGTSGGVAYGNRDVTITDNGNNQVFTNA